MELNEPAVVAVDLRDGRDSCESDPSARCRDACASGTEGALESITNRLPRQGGSRRRVSEYGATTTTDTGSREFGGQGGRHVPPPLYLRARRDSCESDGRARCRDSCESGTEGNWKATQDPLAPRGTNGE